MAESLTVRRRETDAGYNPLAIGTRNRAWPAIKVVEDENGKPVYAPGVIQSDVKGEHLTLLSNRKYAEAMPDMIRNMPVPSVQLAFEAVTKFPLVYIESGPAFGKTRTATEICNAMHQEGAVIYHAGSHHGNLGALLHFTAFDTSASKDLVALIKKALHEGTMNELSLMALRELKVDAKDKDGNTLTDNKEQPVKVSLLTEEGSKKVFNWEDLKTSGLSSKDIEDVFERVKKFQGWEGGLSIGFKEEEGALIKAAREHRPLIIDELSRMTPGTENGLQNVWEVLSGKIKEADIPLGDLGSFRLKFGDIPKTVATGNALSDGAGVSRLPDSMRDRFVEVQIKNFTKADWVHAISQDLCGLPVTTLAQLENGQMEHGAIEEDATWKVADHNKFRRNLESIHRANRSEVPPLETKLLDHWEDVIAVSRALARACYESAQLLDPDSDLYKQQDMGRIRLEVNMPGDAPKKMTRRTVKEEMLQLACYGGLTKKDNAQDTLGLDYSDWNEPLIRDSKKPIEAEMGDRLKIAVKEWICKTAGMSSDGKTAKRPHLYEQLVRVWKEAGVIGPDSVLDRLNIKSTAVEATTDEVRQAQAVINHYLTTQYSEFGGVTEQDVELFLKGLQKGPPKPIGEEKVQAHVLTSESDSIQSGTFTDAVAVVSRTSYDTKPGGNFSDFLAQYPPEKLVDQNKVISTLDLPYVGKELLHAISKAPDGGTFKPEASYSNNAPYVITTTIAKSSENGTDLYAKLHVLHNKQSGKSLVIAFTNPTIAMGRDSSVTVVNAQDKNAANLVNAWLGANAQGASDELRAAFEERNTVPTDKASARLEALLTDTTIKTVSPTMLDGSHKQGHVI